MNWLLKILVSSLAIMVTAYILPGVELKDYLTGILLAIVLSFLNAFIKPLLILFTIPATIFTLGLFLLVVNAIIILFADYLVDGFEVAGFWTALFFSIVLTIITSLFESIDSYQNNNN